MKDVVRFFWERWHRAVQMDSAAKIQGKPTHTWTEAVEWIDAFKSSLSKGKQNEFDKEWNKLEAELDRWHNAKDPKKVKNLNPMNL